MPECTPPLKALQIELTTHCNERCVHCYIPHENKTADMEQALLECVIDQSRDMGVREVTISGGEPMLNYTNFLHALTRFHQAGFKIRIFSNLTLLDQTILEALRAFGIHEVQTSLYSVDPKIHDAITRLPGSCEKTKDGIEKLLEYGIPVFVSCPLMKQNKDSYPGVLAYAKSLGLRSAPDNMIMAQSGGGVENLENRLSVDEALRVIASILEHDTAYNNERFLPRTFVEGTRYRNEDVLPCVQNIGKESVCVNAQGEILPLPAWNMALGDMSAQTLPEIWTHSAELKKIRAISLDDFPQCKNCPDIQFCGMSLEGNANENPEGNPFIIPEYVCQLARRTRELVHAWHEKNNTAKEAV